MLRDELGDDHVVIADLCLDEYTDHGHCGLLDEEGHVDNDATLERYRRIALAQAAAGAQMVGPSGMMDGQVEAIRDTLDQVGSSASGSWPTPRSSPPRSTGRSAKPPSARRGSATGPATRWTRRTPTRRSARSRPTSSREPTS